MQRIIPAFGIVISRNLPCYPERRIYNWSAVWLLSPNMTGSSESYTTPLGLLTFHSRIEISLQIRSIAVTTPALLRTCNAPIDVHSINY